jgi:hypothetical protein
MYAVISFLMTGDLEQILCSRVLQRRIVEPYVLEAITQPTLIIQVCESK